MFQLLLRQERVQSNRNECRCTSVTHNTIVFHLVISLHFAWSLSSSCVPPHSPNDVSPVITPIMVHPATFVDDRSIQIQDCSRDCQRSRTQKVCGDIGVNVTPGLQTLDSQSRDMLERQPDHACSAHRAQSSCRGKKTPGMVASLWERM